MTFVGWIITWNSFDLVQLFTSRVKKSLWELSFSSLSFHSPSLILLLALCVPFQSWLCISSIPTLLLVLCFAQPVWTTTRRYVLRSLSFRLTLPTRSNWKGMRMQLVCFLEVSSALLLPRLSGRCVLPYSLPACWHLVVGSYAVVGTSLSLLIVSVRAPWYCLSRSCSWWMVPRSSRFALIFGKPVQQWRGRFSLL